MSTEATLKRIATDLSAIYALTAKNTAAIAAQADVVKALAAQVTTLGANAGVTVDTTEVDQTLATLEQAMQAATDQAALTPAPTSGAEAATSQADAPAA